MLKAMHGELRTPEGKVLQFRYHFADGTAPDDAIATITTRYVRDSVVLWIRDGFIPEDTSQWGDWTMQEPDEFTELEVVFVPDGELPSSDTP